jgi:SAM-dependent methyltransferase
VSLLEVGKSTLSVPWVYAFYQRMVGAPRCHQRFLETFVRPKGGDRVVDLGCGVGAGLQHLPSGVFYVGIDISREYIQAARVKFGRRGIFVCASVDTVDLRPFGPFDVAMAFGVLHHLSDAAASAMVRLVSRASRPGGRLVTLDPCLVTDQPRLARFLVEHDRGRYVRPVHAHRDLLSPYGEVEAEVVSDMLRIPYPLVIATVAFAATKAGAGDAQP